MECAAPVKDKGYEEIPYGSKPAGIPLLHFSKHTIRFCECMDLLDGLKMKVDPIDKPSNHDCGHHRSNSDSIEFLEKQQREDSSNHNLCNIKINLNCPKFNFCCLGKRANDSFPRDYKYVWRHFDTDPQCQNQTSKQQAQDTEPQCLWLEKGKCAHA